MNPHAEGPDFRHIVIAYTGASGQGYVGFDDHRDDTAGWIDLADPYVLTSGYLMSPQGQIARPFILYPVELLVGVRSLRVRYDALLRLRDLDDADFKAVIQSMGPAMKQADAMRAAVRTQRSGVVLATVMPGRG